MPRKPRTLSYSGVYHIILRSINQQLIFEDQLDYQKFLFILSDCRKKHDIDIYAYCLMDNHIHLLISASPDKLSAYFRSVGTRFALWYNRKYNRYGHLFQERFHSKPVESAQYYLNVLMYIHNNPVNAGICRFPSEYYWSSFNAFYGAKNPLINKEFSYSVAGSKEVLQQFFATKYDSLNTPEFEKEFEIIPKKHYVSEEYALERFKSLTNLSSTSDVQKLPKPKRNEIIRLLFENNFSKTQIARFLGISRDTVKRVCES